MKANQTKMIYRLTILNHILRIIAQIMQKKHQNQIKANLMNRRFMKKKLSHLSHQNKKKLFNLKKINQLAVDSQNSNENNKSLRVRKKLKIFRNKNIKK